MSSERFSSRDLRAATRGDEAAFARLFRALQPLVLRYLSALARDAAEDLAAETWVQVVRGLREFRGDEAGFRAWVFTIAHHRYVDHVRRAARQPVLTDELPDDQLAAPVRVEDEVEHLLSTERALALLGRLPVEQAQVLLLRVVAGLDVARTAEVLGRRPGTVRVLAHRGLRRLAQLLDEPAPDASVVTLSDPSSVTGES